MMKRHFFILLFATLIMCFGSSSVFADMMNLHLWSWDYDISQHLDIGIYDDFWYPQYQSDWRGHLNGEGSRQESITYNDENIEAYTSSSVAINRTTNGFTVSQNMEFYSQILQPTDGLWVRVGICNIMWPDWSVDTDALLKVEIKGAIWDETVDPYFNLRFDGPEPMEFEYDGTYYTTIVNKDVFYSFRSQLSFYPTEYPSEPFMVSSEYVRDCQINCTFEVIPAPSAVILAGIGLAFTSRILKRRKEL